MGNTGTVTFKTNVCDKFKKGASYHDGLRKALAKSAGLLHTNAYKDVTCVTTCARRLVSGTSAEERRLATALKTATGKWTIKYTTSSTLTAALSLTTLKAVTAASFKAFLVAQAANTTNVTLTNVTWGAPAAE